VIATRNRPDLLREAVESLLQQTVLPAELCIVDASEEAQSRLEIEALCEGAGLRLDYVHPAPTGLTVQRNLGIDRTTGDPVFFLDDDAWMAPDVHEEVLAEYERWGPELGGVRGVWIDPPAQGRLSLLWRRSFGMETWRAEASGRMRPGFFTDVVTTSAEVRRVESFVGWFMSFRREVFEHERFDETLGAYAFKEDADFSYRVVRRGYVLVQTPRARIRHAKSPSQRLSAFELQRMNMTNHVYLHHKNMPQDLHHRLALWWGLTGTFLLNLGKAVQTRDPGWATGMIAAAWDQVTGRKRIPGP
jgi:glycosyltransferase involved in cell wall biosynthesis